MTQPAMQSMCGALRAIKPDQPQPRVSSLIRGKIEKCSLNMLITLVTQSGKKVELKMVAGKTYCDAAPISLLPMRNPMRRNCSENRDLFRASLVIGDNKE